MTTHLNGHHAKRSRPNPKPDEVWKPKKTNKWKNSKFIKAWEMIQSKWVSKTLKHAFRKHEELLPRFRVRKCNFPTRSREQVYRVTRGCANWDPKRPSFPLQPLAWASALPCNEMLYHARFLKSCARLCNISREEVHSRVREWNSTVILKGCKLTHKSRMITSTPGSIRIANIEDKSLENIT